MSARAIRTRALAILTKINWIPLLLTRLTLGWVFIESGWGKLHNLPKVIEFFTQLGIPAPELQAPFVAGVELVGGILIFVGLLTRLASVPLAFTMVIAIATAKWEEVKEFSDMFGFSEFLYILLFLVLIVFGAGCVSLDYVVGKKLDEKA